LKVWIIGFELEYKALISHQNQHGNEIPIKAVVPPNLGFRAFHFILKCL